MREVKYYKGYTYEEALTERKEIKEAIKTLRTGQSYTIGSRSLTRVKLSELMEQLDFFNEIIDSFENGHTRPRIQRAIPQDF